jgi:hypothetical protein
MASSTLVRPLIGLGVSVAEDWVDSAVRPLTTIVKAF